MQTRITLTKLNRIFLCFSKDITASETAQIAGVNRNTVNRYFNIIRKKIFRHSIEEYEKEVSGNNSDETCLLMERLHNKVCKLIKERPVLALLKRGTKVFVTVIKEGTNENLMSTIKNISANSTAGIKALKECSRFREYKNNEEEDEHVSLMKEFLDFAKERLTKFNGFTKDSFLLHLKECEFRYNHRNEDLLKLIKKIFRKY